MKSSIAFQELDLNIKHQKIKPEGSIQLGYEFKKGNYIFALLLKFDLKLLRKGERK